MTRKNLIIITTGILVVAVVSGVFLWKLRSTPTDFFHNMLENLDEHSSFQATLVDNSDQPVSGAEVLIEMSAARGGARVRSDLPSDRMSWRTVLLRGSCGPAQIKTVFFRLTGFGRATDSGWRS